MSATALRVYLDAPTMAGGSTTDMTLANGEKFVKTFEVDPSKYDGTIQTLRVYARFLITSDNTGTGTLYIKNSTGTTVASQEITISTTPGNISASLDVSITSIPASLETYDVEYSGLAGSSTIINSLYMYMYITNTNGIKYAQSYAPIYGWYFYSQSAGSRYNGAMHRRTLCFTPELFASSVSATLRAVMYVESNKYTGTLNIVASGDSGSSIITSLDTTSTTPVELNSGNIFGSLTSNYFITAYHATSYSPPEKYFAIVQSATIRVTQKESDNTELKKFVCWTHTEMQHYENNTVAFGRTYSSEPVSPYVHRVSGQNGYGTYCSPAITINGSTVQNIVRPGSTKRSDTNVMNWPNSTSSLTAHEWNTVSDGNTTIGSAKYVAHVPSAYIGDIDVYVIHQLYLQTETGKRRRIFSIS